MIKFKHSKADFGIMLPTNISEITPEAFDYMMAAVKLPKHYCIVALCFQTKLFDFVASLSNNTNGQVSVTAMMAKISEEDSELINSVVGDVLIIDKTSLERGVHVNVNTSICSTFIRNYIGLDQNCYKDIISGTGTYCYDSTGEVISTKDAPDVFMLEFKILPVNDISASIALDDNVSRDPFIALDEDSVS